MNYHLPRYWHSADCWIAGILTDSNPCKWLLPPYFLSWTQSLKEVWLSHKKSSRVGGPLDKKTLTQLLCSRLKHRYHHTSLYRTDSKKKMAYSRAAFQQKSVKYFLTVNHTKVIWDPKKKLKGITGRHLNIQSLMPKRDEIQHLLVDSNFLALTETWLSSHTATTVIDVPCYTCTPAFAKTDCPER